MEDSKHIFLVEDELHLRQTLILILRNAGYQVTSAEDGSEAWSQLLNLKEKSENVDLLVTDIQMPGLSGIELIDKLEKLNFKLPSLVITGYGDKETVIELMRRGCSEYIDKPFEPSEFLKRVKIALEKEEQKRAESEKQVIRVEEEKSEINRKVETYRQHFEKLREQVDLAVGAYQDLVKINEDSCKVPVTYRFKPFAELGGDFVDIRDTETGCDILVADVSGHDMGASYHAVLIKALFNENGRISDNGQSFFEFLNKHLIEHGKHKRVVTAIFLRLNLKKMEGELSVAAHPPLIWLKTDLPVPERLYTKGSVLGIFEDAEYDTRIFPIKYGDRLFLCTDGITNACRVDGPTGFKMKFSGNGLENLIKKYHQLPLKKMIEHIWEDVFDFCRHKPQDDMLLLGVEIPEVEKWLK